MYFCLCLSPYILLSDNRKKRRLKERKKRHRKGTLVRLFHPARRSIFLQELQFNYAGRHDENKRGMYEDFTVCLPLVHC